MTRSSRASRTSSVGVNGTARRRRDLLLDDPVYLLPQARQTRFHERTDLRHPGVLVVARLDERGKRLGACPKRGGFGHVLAKEAAFPCLQVGGGAGLHHAVARAKRLGRGDHPIGVGSELAGRGEAADAEHHRHAHGHQQEHRHHEGGGAVGASGGRCRHGMRLVRRGRRAALSHAGLQSKKRAAKRSERRLHAIRRPGTRPTARPKGGFTCAPECALL